MPAEEKRSTDPEPRATQIAQCFPEFGQGRGEKARTEIYERDGVCGTSLGRPLDNLLTAGTRGDSVRVDRRAIVGSVREGRARSRDCRGEWWRTRPGPVAALGETIRGAFLVAELRAVRCAAGLGWLRRVYLDVFRFS